MKQSWKAGNMLYPVPSVMVSCQRPGEKPNIITVAWAGTVCSAPPMVSISVRPERYSHDIIKETGVFVINLTTGRLIRAADLCGVKSGRDTDKFRELRLTAGKAFKVSCPVIEESPVNIECRVKKMLSLGSHDMFLAEVLCVDVSEEYLDKNGSFELDRTGLTVYSHGEYFALGKKLGKFGFSVKKRTAKHTGRQ
ncbi:MAG: flavin reductase family protein [Lachnospiraceae bacterium]|nr:flavin reductase family protein [Lachnospiraceae bacterium]